MKFTPSKNIHRPSVYIDQPEHLVEGTESDRNLNWKIQVTNSDIELTDSK